METFYRETLEMLNVRRGHSSQSMTNFYSEAASRDQQRAEVPTMRAFINHLSASETRLGRCLTGSRNQKCHAEPCFSAPMSLWDPSVWDISAYVTPVNCRSSVTPGLLRGWSDLDRTGALVAHLAALDEELRS